MNYEPFTEEEFLRLEKELNSITTHLPEDKTRYIWESVSKIRSKKSPQPCSCKSSARLWSTAINDLRDFVNEKKGK